ncbi:MAG: hypothetical protein LBH98_03075 [Chitinispirillales bacterium]|jgi:hypothetical protein|nr:hypothetical protein [Chitinispirillales bacterium]
MKTSEKKVSNIVKIAVYLLAFAGGGGETVFADVSVSIKTDGIASATFTNNTQQSWRLGGFRYETIGGQWDGVDDWQMTYMISKHNPEELYYKSTAPADNMANLKPGPPVTWGHKWVNKDFSKLAPKGEVELLLKTGAPGIPDEPAEYPPITSIDSLLKIMENPDFYRADYRYLNYDSLGSNGGKYSGGFMDTYIGQTQLHFAIPKGSFTVNGTNVSAMRGDNAPQYYMALGMGQEFLRVDAQWMFAMGTKETFSGTTQTPWSTDANAVASGNYTNWHVEGPTMLDRALGYSQFFPKYEARLSAARDVTSSGISITEFANYYVGAYNGQTSPRTINGLFVSALVQYINYDVMAYATDICWKYALGKSAECGDPYMGLAAMVAMYNRGQWSQIGAIKSLLNNNNVDNIACDPNARNKFDTGANNYRPDIINVAQILINASKDFEKGSGANSELIDFKITLDYLREMFFGAGGTAAKQGDGGILMFYYDPETTGKDYTAIRQKIWNNLTDAFNILKGKAPTSDANTISYRYDFLSAIRTVKADLPYERRFQQNGDASTLIPQNSSTGCGKDDGGVVDETYPTVVTLNITPDDEFCVVEVKMNDDNLCKQVKWSIDYDWAIWNNAVMVENASAKNNTFRFEIPKSMADGFKDRGDESGNFVWIMAEDAAGNSVVKKSAISFVKTFKRPEPKWAAVFDTTGDGYPDMIKAVIIRNDLKNLTNAEYSWSWGGIKDKSATSGEISVNKDTLFVKMLNSKDGAGNGWLYMEYDSLDNVGNTTGAKIKDSISLADSCGPAIKNADFYPGASGEYDTLKVEFTESVINTEIYYGSADVVQLLFATNENGDDESNECYAVRTYEENDNILIFLFENRQIATDGKLDYFWVKMVYGLSYCPAVIGVTCPDLAPITDEKENPPLEINRRVPIIDHTKSSLLPEIVSAEMFDNWGNQNGRLDGAGDSLFVTLKIAEEEGAYTAYQIASVEIEFAGETASKTAYPVDDSHFYFIDRTLTAGSGTGEINIIFASGEEVNGVITDKVAPVIISANYERYDSKQDTLRVKFSEPILSAGNSPILADRSGAHGLKEFSRRGNEAVYVVTDGSHFVYGDSIWIAANKGVKDDNGNEQTNGDNQRIKIDYFRYTELKINSAAYFDISNPANGYVDLIKIDFDFGPDGNLDPRYVSDVTEIMEKGLLLPQNRHFKPFTANNVNVVSPRLLEISLSQDTTKVLAKTSVDESDNIHIEYKHKVKPQNGLIDTLGILASGSENINDSIAPIITMARFSPMNVQSDNVKKITDTLYVWFSEPIKNITNIEIQAFSAVSPSRNHSKYSFKFNEIWRTKDGGDSVGMFLIDYNAGDTLPIGKSAGIEPDSIRIEGGFDLSDYAGNSHQWDTNTIYAEIRVGKYDYSYDIKIYPNPYNTSSGKFNTTNGIVDKNPVIEKFLPNKKATDMAVLVAPLGHRAGGGATSVLSGRISVLDPLGNKIIDNEKFDIGNDGITLIWTWNGKNKNGRIIGAGLYKAIIRITNETEKETKELLEKIGIGK